MFKLFGKLFGLGVALALLALATGTVGQVGIAQSCTVVLRPGDSIQDAIDNVPPNSVICLTEGAWQENLTITKDNLTLRGQGPSKTFIIGSILLQVTGRFTLENLTLTKTLGLANTPWPMLYHDPQHTGRSPYVGPASPTLKWRFKTENSIRSSPAIGADGTIYVVSWDGYLYAIDPDGTEKWRFEATDFIDSSPAIGADGTIYVGSTDHYLYAINPDGREKWRFKTGNEIYSSPAIGADGTIYVGSRDGYLYAINPDGTFKWAVETGGAIYTSPAIGADGTIYVTPEDRYLYAINPDGTFKWAVEIWAGAESPAIGPDGTIYVGRYHHLYAINPDGTIKWSIENGLWENGFPVSIGADGKIYAGGYPYGGFSVFDPDGTEKGWVEVSRNIGGYLLFSAIGADGTIYVGSMDGYLYAIGPK